MREMRFGSGCKGSAIVRASKRIKQKARCKWRRMLMVNVLISVQLLVSACSATELEDRCFPMLAVADCRLELLEFAYGFPELSQKENTDMDEANVDAATAMGANFASAVANYNRQLDKKADCNHLKVFVIGEELLRNEAMCSDMWDSLRQSELFPRNVYVCAARDLNALWETEPGLSTDLGSYLETFLLNHEEEHDGKLVTLGTILDELLNHSRKLRLPRLSVENGSIIWDGDWKIE